MGEKKRRHDVETTKPFLDRERYREGSVTENVVEDEEDDG